MANTTLIKSALRNSIAEGIYNEITNRNSRYFYFLGKTLTWDDELLPLFPVDSTVYTNSVRDDIITVKAITPADVAFVVPRYEWIYGQKYDQYDDQYSTEVLGINLTAGGSEYTLLPQVYIGSNGSVNYATSSQFSIGQLLKSGSNYYIVVDIDPLVVSIQGTSGGSIPTHTTGTAKNGDLFLKWVDISDGGGSGATASATLVDGVVTSIDMTNKGIGYTDVPSVTISDSVTGNLWIASRSVYFGQQIIYGNNLYIVTTPGVTGTTPPIHGSDVTNAGHFIIGTQYTILTVGTTDFTVVGSNSNAIGTVFIANGIGTGTGVARASVANGTAQLRWTVHSFTIHTSATGTAVITKGPKSSNQKIEDCQFYTFTDEHNVYICLDNNKGADSKNKPVDTDFDPVTYPDGYIWKFLYNVPIGLRNKFLTTAYVPVVTSIQDQFYSNGNIQVVRVDRGGTDYTSASISVIGDGYLEANPIYLTSIVIDEPGSGYVAPTIVIDEPFLNVLPWIINYVVVSGQKYSYNNNIYEVVVSGQFSTYPPVHKYETYPNGTATLKYVGTRATGNITQSGGAIDSITLNENVREINIVTHGSGYLSSYPIPISFDGIFTNAKAIAIITNTSVSRIIVTDSGTNYTSTPIIVVGTQWTQNTAVASQHQVFFGANLYTITTPGVTGVVAPTHTDGTAINGTATLTYVGSAATAECTMKTGAGYSLDPNITITDSAGVGAVVHFSTTKSDAKLIPIIVGGQLSHVQIDDGGVGYTYANLTVSGDGIGAATSAQLSIGDANTLQSNVELLTVDGTINNIPVISGGFGYTSATVTIKGDGTGATAIARISDLGAIDKITITNQGKNYRWAEASISGLGVNVTYGGVKYVSTEIPSVTFSDSVGDGAGTTAVVTSISNGAVVGVSVTNAGSAYTVAPTVTIGAPFITFDGSASVDIGTDSINYPGQLFSTNDIVRYTTGGGTAISSNITTFVSIADVNSTTHVISMVSHPFVNGDQILYSSGSGIAIGGLVDQNLYYVIYVTSDSIKLASSYANAVNAISIPILAGGVVTNIPVLSGGRGYLSAEVLVTGTSQTVAHGIANISNGVITSIAVTGGSGYTSVPSVSIVAPASITPTATGFGPVTKSCTGVATQNTIVVPALTTSVTGLGPIVTSGGGNYNETSIAVVSYAGVVAGMLVTGAGIAAGTKVLTTPVTTTVLLDKPNTATFTSSVINFLSTTVVVGSNTGIVAGMPVTGTGIANGAKVLTTPSTTTVTLDLPNTSAVSGTISIYVAADMLVIGAGISSGTRVLSNPSSTTVTLTAPNANTVGLATQTPTATGLGPLTPTGTGLGPLTPTGTGAASSSNIIVSSYTNIIAGMHVSGTGIAVGAKVLATPVSTTVVLDTPNTSNVSGTITFTSPFITVSSYTDVIAGMFVSGTGIGTGAKVVSTTAPDIVTLDITNAGAVSGTITFTSPFITVSSHTGIIAGMNVSGTGIGTGARVLTTPTTNTITLDTTNTGAVSGTITFDSILTFVGTKVSASSHTGIIIGMNVSGTGIASGARVLTTPTTNTIALDTPNTGVVSGTLTFSSTGATLGTPIVTTSVSQNLTYKLNSNQDYYIISTPNTIQLAKERDGAAINFTQLGIGSAQRLTMHGLSSGAAEAVAVLTPGASGHGAKLRAIIAPYGGYGKEAINNLFARTLMFYTNISADKNQGFTVNNDYRQIGILKNPRQYASTYALTNSLSSACWVISTNATIDPVLFPQDSIIYLNYSLVNQTRYRIVSNAGLSLLVQSLDNGTPVLNATFVNSFSNGRGASFIASTVTPPTMDKYSGDLLFIDNKQAFTPSEEQIVSIRTVLKF